MDALLTYGDGRVSYSALRSLASLGLEVAVADTGKVGMCQWSRYSRRNYIYTDPLEHTEAFVNDIIRILKESGARFLLPGMHDTEILARYRNRLPDGVVLPVAALDKIHMANDKGMMADYARGIGVNVPEVIEWKSYGELKKGLSRMGGQVVVKLRTGYSANWVFFPSSGHEAVTICKGLVQAHSLGPDRMPMVQERVCGDKWGVACLYHRGRRLASFTQKMLREKPTTGGSGTLRVSARNPLLEAWAEKLLDGMSWHGIAMVEFKQNAESGDAWFIEINPRLWGSISHAVASGVDLVKLLYVASTQGPDEAASLVRPQKEGVVSRWLLGEAITALSEAGRLGPLKTLKLLMPGGANDYDDFKMDDPLATAGEIVNSLSEYLRHKKHEKREMFPVSEPVACKEMAKKGAAWMP